MVLVFGILGIVFSALGCCLLGLPFGIAAWVMGNTDLSQIDIGRMDASGRGTVQAGRICGMVSVGLVILSLIAIVIMFALGIALPEAWEF